MIEGLFSIDETDILRKAVASAPRVGEHTVAAHDADGNESPLAIWNDLGDDVFGAVSSNPRIVNSIRSVLRDEVYHWHSKVMLKYPEGGGARGNGIKTTATGTVTAALIPEWLPQ